MATAVSRNTSTLSRSDKIAAATEKIFSAAEAQSPLRMVLYGINGSGKTHFSGSSDLPTLIVDCEEEGYDAVSDRPNVKVFPLKSWLDKDGIYWYLKSGKHPYKVIVIDTITMMSTLCMKWILGEEVSRDSSADPLMPDRRHYGKLAEAMSNMIIEWRNLPYHTIFLAQERSFAIRDEMDNILGQEIGPSLTPKPLSTLLGAVGTIGRLSKREVEKTVNGKKRFVTERRLLVSGGDEKYIVKTRIKGLKKVTINPTLSEVLRIRDQRGEVQEGQAAQTGVEI